MNGQWESFNKDLLNCAKYGSYLNIKNKKTYKIEAPKVLIKNLTSANSGPCVRDDRRGVDGQPPHMQSAADGCVR